jgi:hypothetical protein
VEYITGLAPKFTCHLFVSFQQTFRLNHLNCYLANMVNPKSARRIISSDSESDSPNTRQGQVVKSSQPSCVVDGDRVRKVSQKKAIIGESRPLTFPPTVLIDTQAEEDKENAQRKKMERLQAQNAKMKKKLKANADSEIRTQFDQYSLMQHHFRHSRSF